LKNVIKMKFYSLFIRISSILFLLFISLFAFDSLGNILGFLIHLIPSFIILITILIAWSHNYIGGIIFVVLGILSLFFFHFKSLIISLPIIIIGILFLLEFYFLKPKYGKSK